VLSLDGGGVRGAVSIAFLEALERRLAREQGRPVLLCEWFDLIGGTSTGAIIAGALALGYRAADIRAFYERLGPRVFKRAWWRLPGLQSRFDGANLMAELDAVMGERTLGSPDLRTRLAIITKRLDTGSPWILTNNPGSAYWETPPDGAFIGNRHYRLKEVIRASAAAPHYFEPQRISVAPGLAPGLFVDGGVTPYNNPALLLLMAACLPQYGLAFPTGAERLHIVSVGTGSFRERLTAAQARDGRALPVALRALTSQIADAQQLALAMMSWLGASTTPWEINAELGDLGAAPRPCAPLFTFSRYDIRLEQDWLAQHLGEHLDEPSLARLRRMDDPANIAPLYRLAEKAAALQIGP